MRNEKLKEMIEFMVEAVEQMMQDPNFRNWSCDRLFTVAFETTISEFSSKGKNSPVASVDNSSFAFNSSEDAENIELIMIHGEDFFNDEN